MIKKINLIVNPSEIAAGTRGASLGPEAIKTAARNSKSHIFSKYKVAEIKNFNQILDNNEATGYAKNIDNLIEVYKVVTATISDVVKNQSFPIVLAGDHASAGATVAGLKNVLPNARIGVVWIDAHGDLHSPYTTPSGNMHGMPLSVILGEDNKPCQINPLNDSIIQKWEELKAVGFSGAKVIPEDLIFVGVRDTEPEENEVMKRLELKNFSVEEVRKSGAKLIAIQILEKLMNCDAIYISFDVDSMDPELTSFGTGTPVANGLSKEEAKELLINLVKSEKVIAFELVEVNPCLDNKKNKMAEIAFELIESVIDTLENRGYGA
jgi:arginase